MLGFYAAFFLAFSSPNPWNFAVIGDIQARPRIYRKAIQQMQKNSFDFGVNLGDIHWCADKRAWKRKLQLAQLTQFPWRWVIGNHELWTCQTRPRMLFKYRSDFVRLFGPRIQSWIHKGWKFVILDTASPYIPKGDILQIRQILQNQQIPTMIFAHRGIPIPKSFKIGRRQYYSSMGPLYHKKRNRQLWQIIDKNRQWIKVIFHGHYHAYRRYVFPNGILGICSGGGGGTLQRKSDFYHWLKIRIHKHQFKIEVKKL